MKVILIACCAVAVGLGSVSVAEETPKGMSLTYRHISPDKDEDWDSAAGVEAQLRFWQNDHVAIAASLGVDRWKAVHEFTDGVDELGYYAVDVRGSATLIPVGVSVLLRSRLSENLAVTFDGGVRYVIVDSSIDVAATEEDASGLITYVDPVDIDNSWLGVIGFTVEGAVDETVWLYVGMGYQFDLTEPSESFLGDDIGDTSLQGVEFRVGLNWMF